jgi:hypothetical protein
MPLLRLAMLGHFIAEQMKTDESRRLLLAWEQNVNSDLSRVYQMQVQQGQNKQAELAS